MRSERRGELATCAPSGAGGPTAAVARDPASDPAPISAEEGGITILIIGLCMIALTLTLGVVTVTSAQLARMRLLDAADAAALDAADALAGRAYADGIGAAVPLTDDTVWIAAQANLAARPLPDRMQSWHLDGGTGTPDGETAVVVVTGTADLPILSSVVEAVGSSITLTVEARARADVDP